MNQTIFSKQFSFYFSIAIILSSLSGCNPQQKDNTDSLEFWTMQLKPNFTNYFADLNTNFETQNQTVKLRWVDVPWSAMENKILTSISAKTAPDVVNLNPKFASQLAARNAWLNLDEVVRPEVKATYLPKIWQASTIEVCQENKCSDRTFGLPWYLTTTITIYNKTLLNTAGIQQPPQTYQELAAAAKIIKEKTGKYAFFISFVPNDSGDVLESLVKMGVNLIDESGRAAFDTTEGKAAFQYWVDLYQQELIPPEVLTQGHRYGIELYQMGETALLSSGAEFVDSINNNAPTIAEVSQVAPQISGTTGKKSVAVMNLVIPRDTEKSQQALDYALYVTNTKNQLAFAKASSVLPSTVDAVEQYIKDIEQQPQTNLKEQAKKVSATQLKDAEVLVPVREDLPILQKAIYENLQAAMLNEKTVEKAVKDAANEWDSQIKN
ncbi:sugar ABC transporter substrate-binding protein [Waterburya agarophytonicola K14]|uniref:Sugar ABC transporter substrate-binding protein n=1 Tax=Waterburya agarophytonicola KI4 TaxID=2874699 RepID=A0A964FFW7_9CYAN|nr:sugar ABC transporter substrate-binding protein [Waterburya agarophytonicola]MCC0177371.1 sugar ABC transporter substrate-binding protein [Waterburya agarophytonicola KI4]